MADDPTLKMFEIQAELEKLKEESTRIQKQNNELKNQLVVNDLIQTVNDFQTNISTRIGTIQDNLNALSARALSHDQILSQMNKTLKKIDETLDKQTEILNRQNETIQILKTNVGNQIFMFPIGCSETETILLLGGEDGKNELDSLLILENNRNKWKELNIKLPYPVWGHGAQFLNNNLYIFGGYNSNNNQLNCTYKLSNSLQWEKIADMNQKRNNISSSSVILNNQIWVCGGEDEKRDSLKSVEIYNPEINTWKYTKEMNQCRRDLSAVVINKKIFCSGGYSGEDILNSIECYDPSSDIWTIICNMPQSIFTHGAVEIDGNLIVMGGWNSRQCLKNVWSWNATDENSVWIEKPSLSISRCYFGIAKIEDQIFICGGDSDKGITDLVETFDRKVWRNGPMMSNKRERVPAVVIPIEFRIYLK